MRSADASQKRLHLSLRGLGINAARTSTDHGTTSSRKTQPFSNRSQPTMQEPSGEGIACARGVDHLWRGQRRLDTAFTANAPAHLGGPIRHNHIRPLGQS